MRRRRALTALAVLFLSGADVARAQNPFAGELTVEQEKEMTAQIAAQIRRQAKFVTDPVILDYVDAIGNSLVKGIEPTPYIFRFAVLEDKQLNAFTIGGGYVYLSSAVLEQAGDVNELAGVMAHEIGHDEKRHVARQNEGSGLSTLVTLLGVAAAIAAKAPEAAVAAQGLNVSLQLKHSREFESEADREGIAIMNKTGYDPDGMRRFFQRILAENPGAGTGIPPYLFTHPAVAERIAATKTEIDRIGASKGVKQDDAKLAQMQARLAQILSPDPSGQSGLHARAQFDATKTDPLLAKAREARIDGNDGLADELLAQAQQLEPGDPRVALERASLAEERGDLESARGQAERALALDPSVPLVQLQLGSLNARLGNKSRAAFYLEQAVANFRPKTAARRRAEFELARLEFKLLDESGLAGGAGVTQSRQFNRGDPITWWGEISKRFYPMNPEFQVRWLDPKGAAVFSERIRMSPGGHFSATLRTANAALGTWHLEVRVEESLVENYEFEIRTGA
jgi:predicted Zn-dependent protease